MDFVFCFLCCSPWFPTVTPCWQRGKNKKKRKKIVPSVFLWYWLFACFQLPPVNMNPQTQQKSLWQKKTECFLNVVFSPFCLVTNATRGLVNGFSSSNTYSACNPHSLDAHYCFKYNSSKRVQTRSRTETQRRGKKGGRVRERGVFEVRLSGAMFGTKGEQWGE